MGWMVSPHPPPSQRYAEVLTPSTLECDLIWKYGLYRGNQEAILSVCVLVTQLCPTLCEPMDCSPPWDSVGKDTGVGCLSLL